MRTGSIGLMFAALLVATAAGAETPNAASTPQAASLCKANDDIFDKRVVHCALSSSGREQRFSFKVNFSGGHDDTMASMTAVLDDAPLTCEQGSKTSLWAEDGDVSIECRFSISGKRGSPHALSV